MFGSGDILIVGAVGAGKMKRVIGDKVYLLGNNY